MFKLTEIQHDALVETFNLGVGKAADAMSHIVNAEVTMSVPTIIFQTRAEAAKMLGSGDRRICAITQFYEGTFNTEAILMFPEEKSLEIVRLMVGDSISLAELTEMEQEAMSEIGNIILNSCMGALADVSGKELQGSLPVYHVGTGDEILSTSGNPWEGLVLTLQIDFNIETHEINGYVAFLLDMSALENLQHYIDDYIARLAN